MIDGWSGTLRDYSIEDITLEKVPEGTLDDRPNDSIELYKLNQSLGFGDQDIIYIGIEFTPGSELRVWPVYMGEDIAMWQTPNNDDRLTNLGCLISLRHRGDTEQVPEDMDGVIEMTHEKLNEIF